MQFTQVALLASLLVLAAISSVTEAAPLRSLRSFTARQSNNNNSNNDSSSRIKKEDSRAAEALKHPYVYTFSDVHFDPFYGTWQACNDYARSGYPCNDASAPPYGRRFCDSPIGLVNSSINDVFATMAREQAQDGQLTSDKILFYLGDVLRHKMKAFQNSSMSGEEQYAAMYRVARNIVGTFYQMVTDAAARHFPQQQQEQQAKNKNGKKNFATALHPSLKFVPHFNFLPLVGNEDMVRDYYFVETASNHPALSIFADALLEYGILSEDEAASYRRCGYYSRLLPSSHQLRPLLVINLQTVMYSTEHHPRSEKDIADPCGQFAWLDQQLSTARSSGWAVYILGHIPPLHDGGSWRNGAATYRDKFRDLIEKYTSNIAATVWGHRHRFEIGAFMESSNKVDTPMVVMPAVTTSSGNIPNWMRWSIVAPLHNASSSPCALPDSPPSCSYQIQEIHTRFLDITSMDPSTTSSNCYVWPWQEYSHQFPKHYIGDGPLTGNAIRGYGQSLLPKSTSSGEWLSFEELYWGGVTPADVVLSTHERAKLLCSMAHYKTSDFDSCVSQYGGKK